MLARKSENARRKRMKQMVELYEVPCFSEIIEVSNFKKVVVRGLAPPVHENTNGVNYACSILLTQDSYFLFFLVHFSCSRW